MRPRKHDRHLPACVYLRHGSYYLVKGGRWINLGPDLKAALVEYARRQSAPSEGMPGLLTRWLDETTVADKTRKTYAVVVRQLSAILAEFEPHQLAARDILALLHHHRHKPGMANHMRTVLIGALDLAFMENLVERNVARDVRPLKTTVRDRYLTDAEFTAIRSAATRARSRPDLTAPRAPQDARWRADCPASAGVPRRP